MNDEEQNRFYADPDNRQPASSGRQRSTKPLSTHVPIRFRPEVIMEVKRLAEDDRKTVSAWIRDVVEDEVERRRPRYPTSHAEAGDVSIEGFEAPTSWTLGAAALEDAH